MGSVSWAALGSLVMTRLFEALRAIEVWISTLGVAGETAAVFGELFVDTAVILLWC